MIVCQEVTMSSLVKPPVEDVTILIKTFIRPDVCQRLLDSIRVFYPTVPVVIVNDGDGEVWDDEYTTTVLMDFDSGSSAGRNEGVKHIKTKYTVLCDDDFVFVDGTDLQLWKELIVESELDLLGGRLLRAFEWQWGVFTGGPQNKQTKKPIKVLENGVVVSELVLNFFIADTDVLIKHPWDSQRKTNEHSLYFYNYRGKLNVGWTERVTVDHLPVRNKRYNAYRQRKVF